MESELFKHSVRVAYYERSMKQTGKWPNIFLIIAFTTDLLTPLLIWKGIIPGNLRWLSHGAIAIILFLIPLRMLAFNRIPVVFWLVVFTSLIGIITALLSGQGLAATIWGWWLMFQFPMVGLFAYLQPAWPKNFSTYLLNFLIGIVAFEVICQLGQYRTGEIPGDNLAGTFGQNGTGDLVMFLILVLCFTLGEWLITQRWTKLIIVLVLGTASSILGEMKLFYLAVVILGLIGLLAFIIKGQRVWRIIPISLVLTAILITIVPLYNAIVPSAKELPLESYINNPALLTKYLTFVNKTEVAGGNYYYDIGRNYALVYGWNKISNNMQDMYLGYGIGARSESRSLGILGRGLEEGSLGVTSGTSILVFIQETGLLGILILGGFFLIIILRLFSQIRHNPLNNSNYLRIGIIFFTILWPIWLWYNAAWNLRIPMLIYWSLLGFVMVDFERNPRPELKINFIDALPNQIVEMN
jgi:hypothetical protein